MYACEAAILQPQAVPQAPAMSLGYTENTMYMSRLPWIRTDLYVRKHVTPVLLYTPTYWFHTDRLIRPTHTKVLSTLLTNMGKWRHPFSKSKPDPQPFDGPPPGSARYIADHFLSPSVLWFLFGSFVAASGVMLGISLGQANNNDTTTTRWDSSFYNLMSQVFITILACYCTLIPVLHAHLAGSLDLKVNVVVFYVAVVAALCTAVSAPVVYVARGDNWESASTILNFVSSVSSVITASQLAAGVLKLSR